MSQGVWRSTVNRISNPKPGSKGSTQTNKNSKIQLHSYFQLRTLSLRYSACSAEDDASANALEGPCPRLTSPRLALLPALHRRQPLHVQRLADRRQAQVSVVRTELERVGEPIIVPGPPRGEVIRFTFGGRRSPLGREFEGIRAVSTFLSFLLWEQEQRQSKSGRRKGRF